MKCEVGQKIYEIQTLRAMAALLTNTNYEILYNLNYHYYLILYELAYQ